MLAAGLLAVTTVWIDWAAYRGRLTLPSWVVSGTPDAARGILATLAAGVITVVGVVFSIMIVTLTLASTQFGPRMLRLADVMRRYDAFVDAHVRLMEE